VDQNHTPPSGEESRAQLSAAEINDLPDSAFAYIEPGGKKDDEGKTVPRSLRHYPVHDEPHAQNALARANAAIAGDNADAKAIAQKALPAINAALKKFSGGKQSQRKRGPRPRAVPLAPEVRFFRPDSLEVRREAKDDTDEIIVRGSAIVYGTPYRVVDMFGEFEERIHAGSVSGLLARGVDCRFLFNHDGLPLGRTASRTLALIDGPSSLDIELRMDARQQLANDLAIAFERGDVSQMSVGMIVGNDKWGDNGQMETRDIYGLDDLLDVSAVTYPCSPTTHIEVAKRMAFAMPLESRARLRKMEVELRAGKVLSADSQSKLVTALSALHDLANAGGLDPADLGPNADEDDDVLQTHSDGSEGGTSNIESDAGINYPDGSGGRSADTEAETRDDPTDADYGIASCLQSLKMELAGAKAKQLADPDNGSDPDDVAVMAAINEAEAAIDKAIVAQSKDCRPDADSGMKASTLRLMVEAGRNPSV
jgi:Escherichia/Staphylococcus phage prohead protease